MKEMIKKINWINLSCFPISIFLMFFLNNFLLENKFDFKTIIEPAMSFGLIMFILFFSLKFLIIFEERIIYFFGFLKFIIFIFSLFGLIALSVLNASNFGILINTSPDTIKLIKTDFEKNFFYLLNLYYVIFLFIFLIRHKVKNLPVNFNGKTFYSGEKIIINPFLKFNIYPVNKYLGEYFIFEFHFKDGLYNARVDFTANIDFEKAREMNLYLDEKKLSQNTESVIRRRIIDKSPYKTYGEFVKNGLKEITNAVNLQNPPIKIMVLNVRLIH